MPDHYFTNDPSSEHKVRAVQARALSKNLSFETDAGVFSRDGLDPGSKLLIESAPEIGAVRALDLGCGWGAIGAFLAAANPESQFLLSDVNERAALLAEKNLKANGIRNAAVRIGEGFSEIDGRFTYIFTNPPIRIGKQAIYALFDQSHDFLEPQGSLFIVIRKQQGAPSALNHLREVYASAEVIARGGGYWIIRADKSTVPESKEEK